MRDYCCNLIEFGDFFFKYNSVKIKIILLNCCFKRDRMIFMIS